MQDGKKVIRYMQSKGYRILALNIVYIEDVNADTWQPLKGELDKWDDARCIISDSGDVLLSCEATTEPGKYYTSNPMNSNGAFRIAFGNYLECWKVGDHKGQLALVQCGTIRGHRDLNKDGFRTGDKIYEGDNFGVNQHTTGNAPSAAPDLVGRFSAGCLVGRYSSTHYEKFIKICQGMGKDRFDTSIISGDELAAFL
jgi:hypothetical protein